MFTVHILLGEISRLNPYSSNFWYLSSVTLYFLMSFVGIMMFLINNMFNIPYIEHTYSFAVSLKPELFEGMRVDFTKGLNQRFSLSHR